MRADKLNSQHKFILVRLMETDWDNLKNLKHDDLVQSIENEIGLLKDILKELAK